MSDRRRISSHGTRIGLAIVAAALVAVLPSRSSAQSVEPSRLEVTLEAERLQFTYHFTNPSSFDTPALVPHFFEQHYEIENLWAIVEAHYTAAIPWQTTAGVTPPRDGRADDYDTFFDPDGSVIVSGTTGDARVRSFRASHSGQIAKAGAARLSVGYRFRLDRADFGIGHKTVTRNGALAEAGDVTTREMTSSQLHEFFVSASALRRAEGGRWRVLFDGDVSPVTAARLLVQLPDKYPGQDLVFLARALAVHAQIRAVRTGSHPVEVVVDAGDVWGYHADDSIAFGRVAVGVSFGIR